MIRRFLLCAMLCLLPSSAVLATDRFYNDILERSPNGRYEAKAISAENKGGAYTRAFAREFTVVLKDTSSGKELWSWKQRPSDSSPVELIVTDDGQVIECDASDNFFVFDMSGVRSKGVGAFEVIPETETKEYAAWTTAGTFWRMYSKSGFHAEAGGKFYYIRTYWGRYVVIDLGSGTGVRDAALERRIEDKLVAEVRAWIASFDGVFVGPCPRCADLHLIAPILENSFLIRKHAIPEGEPIVLEALKRSSDGRNSDFPRYLEKVSGGTLASLKSAKVPLIAGGVALLIVVGLVLVLRRRRSAVAPR